MLYYMYRNEKENHMYTVEYGYYKFPSKTKEFKTYESAKKFFYYISKQNGVKKSELIAI